MYGPVNAALRRDGTFFEFTEIALCKIDMLRRHRGAARRIVVIPAAQIEVAGARLQAAE